MTRTEASTPSAVDRPDLRNATDLLAERVRLSPDHIAFARRTESGLVDVTTADFDREARGLARGLVAEGLEPGGTVLVVSPTRYEWAVADLAIWLAGGIVVPVYETASAGQAAAIVAEVRPHLALVSGPEHARLLDGTGVRTWSMDPSDADLTALAAAGAGVADTEIERRRSIAGPDDVATIVYTSGTTARQKGVRLTHGNIVGQVLSVAAGYPLVVNDSAVTIVALPLAHILARGLQLVALAVGMKVVHEGDPTRIVATFAEVRPTFMVVVPRLLEKIRGAARNRANDARLGQVFRAAEETAIAWAQVAEARQDDPTVAPSPGLRLRHALFDRLFYRRLRTLMGGRLEWLLCGAAPLDPSLARFFWGMGVPVIEGYGLTETTAPLTGTVPGDLRPGSVGKPLPGAGVRIADDGEVLVRGVGVTGGYENPSDNEGAFVDGYFRTGDLGSLDAAGNLTLRGRRKSILVTASGKNVVPEPWEEAVARSALVAQAVLIGEGRPYLGALLLLDVDAVLRWAGRVAESDLVTALKALHPGPGGVRIDHPALLHRLQRTVDSANEGVSRSEQARRFTALLVDLKPGSPAFTPTMKLRREPFLQSAREHIEALYSPRT